MNTQMQLSAVTPLSYRTNERTRRRGRSQWSHHENKKREGPMEYKKREEPESMGKNSDVY